MESSTRFVVTLIAAVPIYFAMKLFLPKEPDMFDPFILGFVASMISSAWVSLMSRD